MLHRHEFQEGGVMFNQEQSKSLVSPAGGKVGFRDPGSQTMFDQNNEIDIFTQRFLGLRFCTHKKTRKSRHLQIFE